MKRIMYVAIAATVFVGCGSDDDSSSTSDSRAPATTTQSVGSGTTASPATASASTSTGAATTTTAPTTTVAPTTVAPTTAVATTVAPTTTAAATTTVAPTTSLTANESRAAAGALTAADLPGWTQRPAEDDDDDSGSMFDPPECAALKALEDEPALADDFEVEFVAPDGKAQLSENVTVGDPVMIQAAFDAFANPATAACLTAVFTDVLQQPGVLPDGVTLTGLEFAQQPLVAGDQAIGYVATITVTGTETGITAPIGIRFDAVRAGPAIAVLSTISEPGAAAIDPTAIATAAAQKLTAAA